MGQVILGFRSLLVKIAVFVLMAAMLAWILGGTLWPKTAVRVVGEPVEIDGRTLVLVDQIGGPLDRATFGLATRREGRIEDRWPRAEDMTPAWSDAMAPVATCVTRWNPCESDSAELAKTAHIACLPSLLRHASTTALRERTARAAGTSLS